MQNYKMLCDVVFLDEVSCGPRLLNTNATRSNTDETRHWLIQWLMETDRHTHTHTDGDTHTDTQAERDTDDGWIHCNSLLFRSISCASCWIDHNMLTAIIKSNALTKTSCLRPSPGLSWVLEVYLNLPGYLHNIVAGTASVVYII